MGRNADWGRVTSALEAQGTISDLIVCAVGMQGTIIDLVVCAVAKLARSQKV